MRYRVVLLVAVTLCLFSGAFGFLGVPRSETLRRNYSVRFASYADQLRAAKLAKAGRGGSSPVLPKAPTPPVASATRAESVAQPSSALPFEQDVYENLNFVIGKLSSRMKSGKVLSEEELDQFKAAVGVIVSDAGTVPAVPQQSQAAFSRTQPPQDSPDSSTSASKFEGIEAPHELKRLSLQEADASSPFSALHGLGNTWQIPGMENMDADTYYAKINERNTQMKQRRKEQGTYSRESSSDYLSQLNAVNRTGEGEENPYSDSGYESSD